MTSINLIEGEEILSQYKPRWYKYSAGFLGGVTIIITGLLSWVFSPILGIILIIFGALVLGGTYNQYVKTNYVLTNKRVIKSEYNQSEEVSLEDISRLGTKKNQLYGTGNVVVSSTTAGGDLEFEHIDEYEDMASIIRQSKDDL